MLLLSPSANSQHLDNICATLDNVCDANREVKFLGDLNRDWFSSSCLLKRKLLTGTSFCNLAQVIDQPTEVFANSTGTTSSTCIDHIFTNAAELCSKVVSIPIGCSDPPTLLAIFFLSALAFLNRMAVGRAGRVFSKMDTPEPGCVPGMNTHFPHTYVLIILHAQFFSF